MSFPTGRGNEAFQGEAGQAPELAHGSEQNCVTGKAREDDGKKHNNVPSWWLWEAVRSVQGVFPFTLSNTVPLQCKGLTCLAVLTLGMLEGCRAGDAHAQVAEFPAGGKKGRRGLVIHVSTDGFKMQCKERYPNSSRG